MSDIDLQGALSSPSLGFKYYINYYYQGNTCGISPSEIGQIQSTWSDKLPVWKNYVENVADENVYDIDEDDYNDAMKRGTEYGKDLTGYENSTGDKWGQGIRTGVDGAAAGASAVMGGVSAIKAMKAAGSLSIEGLKQGAKSIGGAMTIISCSLDLAMAILYYCLRPNKTQYEAAMQVADEMGNQQSMLDGAVYDIEDMDAELQALNDEANALVEESNQTMAENKVNYDYSRDTIEYFNADVTSGYRLTEGDVAAYQAALQYMRESGAAITETQDGTQTRMEEIKGDMASYEEGFGDAANTIGEVEGFTAYAEGFDEMTKNACTAEYWNKTIAMYACILDAVLATAKATTPATLWYLIFAAMAASAAYMDGKQAAEQKQWASDIETEITAREATQEMQTSSYETYDEHIDYYGGYMYDVENLEVEVPEDTAPPTETGVPTPAGGSSGGGDGKKKKEE